MHGSSEPREDDEGPGQSMSRLLAVSDGVFAVAITLLVFNLGVAPGQPLSAGLAHFGDRAWAAALSFALIGRYWMIHRRIFARVRRHDDRLLVLNLVFLAAVVAMPSPPNCWPTPAAARSRSSPTPASSASPPSWPPPSGATPSPHA